MSICVLQASSVLRVDGELGGVALLGLRGFALGCGGLGSVPKRRSKGAVPRTNSSRAGGGGDERRDPLHARSAAPNRASHETPVSGTPEITRSLEPVALRPVMAAWLFCVGRPRNGSFRSCALGHLPRVSRAVVVTRPHEDADPHAAGVLELRAGTRERAPSLPAQTPWFHGGTRGARRALRCGSRAFHDSP